MFRSTSSSELYVSYYNSNGAATSGSFFSGFASNPTLNLDLSASKLGSCINESGTSNVVLDVTNNGNFDSLQWEKKMMMILGLQLLVKQMFNSLQLKLVLTE